MSAKQAPVTSPTYPVPTIVMFIEISFLCEAQFSTERKCREPFDFQFDCQIQFAAVCFSESEPSDLIAFAKSMV